MTALQALENPLEEKEKICESFKMVSLLLDYLVPSSLTTMQKARAFPCGKFLSVFLYLRGTNSLDYSTKKFLYTQIVPLATSLSKIGVRE